MFWDVWSCLLTTLHRYRSSHSLASGLAGKVVRCAASGSEDSDSDTIRCCWESQARRNVDKPICSDPRPQAGFPNNQIESAELCLSTCKLSPNDHAIDFR